MADSAEVASGEGDVPQQESVAPEAGASLDSSSAPGSGAGGSSNATPTPDEPLAPPPPPPPLPPPVTALSTASSVPIDESEPTVEGAADLAAGNGCGLCSRTSTTPTKPCKDCGVTLCDTHAVNQANHLYSCTRLVGPAAGASAGAGGAGAGAGSASRKRRPHRSVPGRPGYQKRPRVYVGTFGLVLSSS